MSGVAGELLRETEKSALEKRGRIRGRTPAKITFVQCMELDGRKRVATAVMIMMRAEMECTTLQEVEYDERSHIR